MKGGVETAIILAGGLGLRLRPLTSENPKCMIRVCGKPIAEWQVSWLKGCGVKKIIFAAGYLWQRIEEYLKDGSAYGVKVSYSIEEECLGTGGGLKKALNMVSEDVFAALNGDLITDLDLKDMVDWHRRLEAKATVLVVPFTSPYGLVEVTPKGRARRFIEKPTIPNSWINGGCYILDKEVAEYLPEKGDIETETFPKLAEQELLAAYPHEGFWRTIDTLKDLEVLEKELSRLQPY